MFRRPLRVHLVWSPRDTEAVRDVALDVYGFISRPLADDPVLRPGVGIATEIGRELGGLVASITDGTEPAAMARVLVPILGVAGYADPQFRAAIDRAIGQAADDPTLHLLPIVIDPRWQASLPADALDRVAAISKHAAAPDPGPERYWRLGSDVGVAIGRALFGADAPDATPQIFVSHARADAEATEHVAAALREHIARHTRMQVFFDADNTRPPRRLREQLRLRPREGLFLVVRTDSYSESPWCIEELLIAKAERVPIVTLLLNSAGESHSSAYGGNHRTVHWQGGRQWEVVGRCVQAWLHHHHFLAFGRAALELAGLPSDSVLLSRRPELLDLGGTSRGLLVYPDPPMPEAERDVLRANRPDARVATPSTLYGRVLMDRDPAPPLADTTLAFSLSEDSRLPPLEAVEVGRGITQRHLRDTLDAIVLATIHSGARIAYGGDFRRSGYAEKFSELLQSHRRLGLGGRPQLLCYPRGDDGDAGVTYDPIEIVAPAGTAEFADPDLRSVLWHLAMRRTSSRDSTARVLLGGKSTPFALDPTVGYRGTWPGLLEEAYRTVQAGRALYVVGGFGGSAGEIAELLMTGAAPPALQHRSVAGHVDFDRMTQDLEAARVELGAKPGADPDLLLLGADGPLRMDDLAAALLREWQQFTRGEPSQWSNGLTEAENRALFDSTDSTEVAHLVFAGLARLRDRSGTGRAMKLRCYHGDIASIPGVDAYAVTITPGMEPFGASAALDARCGGRLRRVVPARGVEVIAVGSNALAGRHVVVASLELPPAASAIDPAAVERLAWQVGEECRRVGLTSVACPAFGATLGLDVAASVQAMISGFERAGAPATVTFCEIDGDRLAQLRSALPRGEFEDLREGPLPPTPPRRAVLYLSARAPDAAGPGAIEANLYHDDLGATVPCGTGEAIDAAAWRRLLLPMTSMDDAAKRGALLLDRLLPASVGLELRNHPDAVLSIVLDEVASGLPWESLAAAEPPWTPAITVPVTRRIALCDAESTAPTGSRTGARLRTLLVSDPTGDLQGARDEAAEVARLLGGKAGVALTTIAGPDATVDRVQGALAQGTWDILHYAGHAFFDPAARERSGLKLADGVLLASDLADANVPRLVVLGACESARVRGPGNSEQDPRAARWSFAEGILRRGVRSFIGTFFVVADDAAREFAVRLYEGLLAGRPLGIAVRDARLLLHRNAQPDWANFLLWGDGTLTL